MKIHVTVETMMMGGNRYWANVEYVEDDKNKDLELVNRLSLRILFQQVAETFADKLEDVYKAEITGEFDEELEGEDLEVWETPIKDVIDRAKI